MASSWGPVKRSSGRWQLLAWAVAACVPLNNVVATLFFSGLGVTIR